MTTNYFHDETVTFTSDELCVLQDVLRRVKPGTIFTAQPEYSAALGKIMHAASLSYGNDTGDPAELLAMELEYARSLFPPRLPGKAEMRDFSDAMNEPAGQNDKP
jgi:hypothetical protein